MLLRFLNDIYGLTIKIQLLWWRFNPHDIIFVPEWHAWQANVGFCACGCFFFLSSFFFFSRFQSFPLYIFKATLEFLFFSDLILVFFLPFRFSSYSFDCDFFLFLIIILLIKLSFQLHPSILYFSSFYFMLYFVLISFISISFVFNPFLFELLFWFYTSIFY